MKLAHGSLQVLSQNELYKIHDASLRVLESTGVKVDAPRAMQLFKDEGATVDSKSGRVFLPTALIEEMLRKAPSRFTWYARDPKCNMNMQPGEVYYGTTGTSVSVIDVDSGEKRDATFKDAENLARVADALDNVDEGYCMVHPKDVPDHAAHAYMFLASVKNSRKPFRGRNYSEECAEDCCRMAAILAGGEEELRKKPVLWTNVSTVSPLTLSKSQTEGMLVFAKRNLPVAFSPQIQAGATGPVTLAGTLVQMNAEILSGITLLQIANPGNPVAYGSISSAMDPRGVIFPYGAMELGLLMVATAQLARFYNIPSRGGGGTTDSCTMDMQAGYEGALTLILPTLAGMNLILYAAGGVEQASSVSYEKLVVDDEVIGMVKRIAKGIEVHDDRLSVDVIGKAALLGHYLAEPHTRKYLADEIFIPELATRLRWDSWLSAGRKELREKARDKVRRILKDYEPKPLEKEIATKLEQYVKKVEMRTK